MVRSEGNTSMSLKNPVTPPGIDPGTVRLVGGALTTTLPRPHNFTVGIVNGSYMIRPHDSYFM